MKFIIVLACFCTLAAATAEPTRKEALNLQPMVDFSDVNNREEQVHNVNESKPSDDQKTPRHWIDTGHRGGKPPPNPTPIPTKPPTGGYPTPGYPTPGSYPIPGGYPPYNPGSGYPYCPPCQCYSSGYPPYPGGYPNYPNKWN